MADKRNQSQGPASRPKQLRHLFGLRISALLEIVFLLCAALAADTLLGQGDRFAGIAPHPFWIIVLLVAVQYGAKEGLVAALAASAALLIGHSPEQGFSEDLYDWLLRASREPLLWVFAALLLGEIRDAHRRERDRLREALTETRHQADAIALAYERLSGIKDHLESRVAGQVRTAQAIFAASRSIDREDTGQVLAGIQALVSTVLNPSKFSLFLLQGNVLEAALSQGWAEDDPFDRTFDQASPLFQAVVSQRRDLVVTRPSDGVVLGSEGLMAGPLTCSETGELFGMLKIEALEFLDLHPASVQHFQMLCQWIGWAYSNALRREDRAARHYVDEQHGLLAATLFAFQRDIGDAAARRLGHDLTVLLIILDAAEKAGPALQVARARAIARASEQILGAEEPCLGWLRDGCDPAMAVQIARRMIVAIAAELATPGFPHGVGHRLEPLHRAAGATSREAAE
jgi:hypothetical protein